MTYSDDEIIKEDYAQAIWVGGVCDSEDGDSYGSAHNGAGWAFLRNTFDIPDDGSILEAKLYATASSTKQSRQFVYRTWLNGQFVGLGPVFPIAGESRVNVFDVATLLHAGKNAIGVVAWTMQDRRFWCCLRVTLADGRRLVYSTGPDWKGIAGDSAYPDSPSIGTQYYEAPAENVQMRHYPVGFSKPEFCDDDWPAATVRKPLRNLKLTPTANVTVHYHKPVSSRYDEQGSLIVDFGRTWMGGIKLDLSALRLREDVGIRIRYGEVLNSDGSVKYHLGTSNIYEDDWQIVPGVASFETWGIRVFRYVQLVPADDRASRRAVQDARGAVTAAAIEYPLHAVANFRCDDSGMNDIWRFCRNSIEALNGPIYVDSWTRERAPYEADAWLQQRAHLAIDCSADAIGLGRYSVDWLIANRTWPTEWPMYLILAVYDSWMISGDIGQVRDRYRALRTLLPDRYIDQASGLIIKDPGESSTMDGDLVDWPPSERDGYLFGQVNTVVNALACRAYRIMSVFAERLDEHSDHSRYAHIADRMELAANERLWNADIGAYIDGLDGQGHQLQHASLHANAFMLAFGNAPTSRHADIAELVRAKGMHCGPYVAAVLLEGLYRAGYGALANAMIGNSDPEEPHSWHHMMATGCGATMEGWDVSIKPNTTYSHPWATSPAYLLQQGLLGVTPLEPGYTVFQVRPQLGDLHEASGVVPTPHGAIRIHCVRRHDAVDVELEHPAGTMANIADDCEGLLHAVEY